MTSSFFHMALYVLGSHVLQWSVQARRNGRRWRKSQKADLSADWSLKPDSMKFGIASIAYQHAR